MTSDLKAFKIKVNGKILDYRLGKELDLGDVRKFFEKKRYHIRKLWQGGRHVFGILEKKNNKLFLKLSTTKGISALTENEFKWNENFNKIVSRKTSNFWVPKNYDSGIYNNLFFFVAENIDGLVFTKRPEKVEISREFYDSIYSIIEFSQLIQNLNIVSEKEELDHKEYFLTKTNAWHDGIPQQIEEKYQVSELLRIVEDGASTLQKKTRHGDFTPWHILKLRDGKLVLIDGEHAIANGVEYYDIGYFIQRVFSVLENPKIAKYIFSLLVEKGYRKDTLKVIMAARGIGGFLDESLSPSPNYILSNNFKEWLIKI